MITITASAENHLAELLRQHDEEVVRLVVKAGGCNGFSYSFDFDRLDHDDEVIEWSEGRLAVDLATAELLGDSVVDLVDDLTGRYLMVRIPNASSMCGCGSSFALEIA